MKAPLLMTENYWANCQLSLVRHMGRCMAFGQNYIIVDKTGRDVFELSDIRKKTGATGPLIPPGEPCDLIDVRLQPSYKRLGRERILELLREKKTLEEIKKTRETKK